MSDAAVVPAIASDTGRTRKSRRGATTADSVDPEEERLARSLPISGRSLRLATVFQSIASLLWVPQAALLAVSVGNIAAEDSFMTVVLCAIGVLALGIARSVLDAFGSRMAFRHARTVLSERRRETVAALAARSPFDAGRPASGAAASALAEQAEAIVPYLSRYRPTRMRAVLMPFAILLCVLAYSWAAALVLLVAAPLIPIFMALVGMRAKAASEAQLVELGSMNAFLLDRLRGMTTIRSMQAVDATAKRLRADAENLRARTMAVLRIAFLSSAVLELFAALGVAMVAVYVGFHLLGQLSFGAWGEKLTLAEGLFILLLAPAFFEPLRDLSSVWHDRAAGEAALEALDRLSASEARPETHETVHTRAKPAWISATHVRVENLSFRHAAEKPLVLDGFDLDVAGGEHVALLAPSGGGKSTLIALMAGLATPESGRVLIDGTPLTPATADGLRRGMAWIGQQPHVFPGTIAGNVALGRPEIDMRSARQALRDVGLGPVIDNRGPALIGENGVGLSGGEASRLALARIAAKPGVGLILADEPTAHLDTTTAEAVTETLLALAKGRTLIVATHDPVLAARMNRVVRLTGTTLEDAA
jgi:ATP-binding cassette subfamily C protein CydD